MKKYIQLALSLILTTGFSVFSMNKNELIKERWRSGFYDIKNVKIEDFDEEKPNDIEFDGTGNRILFTVNTGNKKSIIAVYRDYIDMGTCIVEPEKIKKLDLGFQTPFKVKNDEFNGIVKEVNYFIEGENNSRFEINWTWFDHDNNPTDSSSSGDSFSSQQKNKKSFSDRGILVPETYLISKSSKHFIRWGESGALIDDHKNALVVRDMETKKTKYLALFSTDKNDFLCEIMKYSKSLLVAISNNGDTICVYNGDENKLTFFKVSSTANGFNINESQDKAFGNVNFEFFE